MNDFSQLEAAIGYTFQNKALLTRAMTHTSYANESGGSHNQSNERLEFLGDSVLGVITAEYLFLHDRSLPEGELTKLRAASVCEKALCEYAKDISLGSYLLLGKGELCTGGSERPSILADAFEALIAAIFLDGGMDAAKGFVLKYIEKATTEQRNFKDYKTMLQEVVQKNPGESIEYVLVDAVGPDHDKRFTVEVHLHSNVIGTGTGTSKKKAEQAAAKEALALMGL